MVGSRLLSSRPTCCTRALGGIGTSYRFRRFGIPIRWGALPIPDQRKDPAVAQAEIGHRICNGRRELWCDGVVGRAAEETNRRMLRARDAMDRSYAQPLDVPALARIAHVSQAHFSRIFRATFGETPHRYLQRRRVERAMFLLRETDLSATDICFKVGFESPGTFSRTFRDIVGRSPRAYRKEAVAADVPTCFTMAWMRPGA
jgi:AraC-like DNA-binding protein